MDNVIYYGDHSITFTNESGVSRNTWTDWGLVPSSRHSKPRHSVWSNETTITGINGSNDLIRPYSGNVINSTPGLLAAMKYDKRDEILNDTNHKYDIYQPVSGSFTFLIADQTESFFAKQQKILNFLHNRKMIIRMDDDPNSPFQARTTVDSMDSGTSYSSITISYAVLDDIA